MAWNPVTRRLLTLTSLLLHVGSKRLFGASTFADVVACWFHCVLENLALALLSVLPRARLTILLEVYSIVYAFFQLSSVYAKGYWLSLSCSIGKCLFEKPKYFHFSLKADASPGTTWMVAPMSGTHWCPRFGIRS